MKGTVKLGFGTLFFGYFLLLNIAYYSFTDLIAALVMAIGLFKLYSINASFRNAFYTSIAFSAIGAAEMVIGFIDMFSSSFSQDTFISYISLIRYIIIAILTVFILLGIEAVSDEVGLTELAKTARGSIPFAFIIYSLSCVLSIPIKEPKIILKIFSVASVIVLLSMMIYIIKNLVTIYKAYMKICMPEDKDNDWEDKPSRFEFINRHREHTAQKNREYAEYKLEKYKKKTSKKKKK